MELSEVLKKENIIVGIKGGSRTKDDIIKELTDALYEHTSIRSENITKKHIYDGLVKREKEQSTAVGEGFAFPHARFDDIKNFYMIFAVCQEGGEFNSFDQKPVNFFIVSLIPQANPDILLKTRAAVMRFMLPERARKKVLDAEDADDIWAMINGSDIKVNHDIIAADIMRPQIGHVSPEMTLREAAMELHKHHIDSLPILDAANNFQGEISCYELFSYGLPNFFSNLHKISFIKHMNPFEKYFKVDESLRVKDLNIEKAPPVIAPDATIMEIVFEMTAKGKQFLYVVSNQKLMGVIDRYSIIDKVLLN